MATPTLTSHRLPGTLGEILVDVRAAGRDSARPAIVVVHGWKGFKDWGMFPPLAERLARAGFATITFNLSGSGVDDRGELVWPERFGRDTFTAELEDVATVIDVLARGELGVAPPSSIRETAAMTIPGVQNPHWSAWFSWNACWTGWSSPFAARPSIVVISAPSSWTPSSVHDFADCPSTSTVQAPHDEVSHPTAVPVRRSRSRRT